MRPNSGSGDTKEVCWALPQSPQAPKGKLQETQSLIFPWIQTGQDAVSGTAVAICQKAICQKDSRGEGEKETQATARHLT